MRKKYSILLGIAAVAICGMAVIGAGINRNSRREQAVQNTEEADALKTAESQSATEGNQVETASPQSTAEAGSAAKKSKKKTAKPIPTLSPTDWESVDIYRDGLCFAKRTAIEVWDHDPEEYGFENYNDPVYEMIGIEQEYDAEGKPKYTDITIPKKVKGIPVVSHVGFAGHYEIKRLRIKANLTIDDTIFGKMEGCTGLEYYEMAPDTKSIEWEDFKGCRSLTSLVIPKGVTLIYKGAFKGCKKLKKIKFENFSNLNNIEGLRSVPWWKEHVKGDGMTVYKGSLVDAGKIGGSLTIRGGKIKKILSGAFRNSKVTSLTIDGVDQIGGQGDCFKLGGDHIKELRLSNIKRMRGGALSYCGAEKIVLGEGIKEIPPICFGGCRNLKEIRITSKEKIIWGKVPGAKNHYESVHLDTETNKQKKIDIYIYSHKIHRRSLHAMELPKKVTLHVPKDMLQKYRDCVDCKVVALK